jgi:ABC-type amino acid transport substrate-binding protein
MKNLKRIFALCLCAALIFTVFAGCSKAEEAEEITAETMLIAYTAEKEPFIYTDENGKLTGFDVEVFEKIFKDIKNDYKNYKFIKVDKDYRLGEDAAYTNEAGEEFTAYILIGGLEKNKGTFNESYTFTKDVIENRIITVTKDGSKVKDYTSFEGANVGYVTTASAAALDKNSAVKDACKKVSEYSDIQKALADLDSGKLDAVITDEFSFNVLDNKDSYKVLGGELDKISYVYAFKKWDWFDEAVNEAIHELQSPDYNDADEFTPIVEKYFGYDASDFTYNATEK